MLKTEKAKDRYFLSILFKEMKIMVKLAGFN